MGDSSEIDSDITIDEFIKIRSKKNREKGKKNKNSKRARSPSCSPKKGTKITKPSSPLKTSSNAPNTSTGQQSSSMDTSNLDEPLPPPIYVRAMRDYIIRCRELESIIGQKSFTCRSTTNSTTFHFKTSDGYRSAVRYFREKNVDFHTYQLQEEKSFRVVIRHLHHTTPIELIKSELEAFDFKIKNITNVIIKKKEESTTSHVKIPLPLFFVDLEKTPNVEDIFKITELAYTKIKVEEPHKRRDIVQCQRCQQYGHTKAYCNHEPQCIRCAGKHLTTSCTISRQEPAKCVLCGGNHPANYKGCEAYKTLQVKLRKSEGTVRPTTTQQPKTSTETNKQLPPWMTQAPARPDTLKTAPSSQSKRNPQRTKRTPAPPGIEPLEDFPPLVDDHQDQEVTTLPSYASAVSPVRSRRPPLPAYIPPPNPANDMTPLLNRVLSELSELTNLIKPLITTLTTVMTNLLPFLTKCAANP